MANAADALRDAYDLAFQISPIVLVGGSFANSPGGAMPVVGLFSSIASIGLGALTSSGLSLSGALSSVFGPNTPRFMPLPGSTLVSNMIGTYPFANANTAANSIITQPLTISLQWVVPVNTDFGYAAKIAITTGMADAFQRHNALGGTYSIATPAYLYSNCVMTGMSDITSAEDKQQQTRWELDFTQPLISQNEASVAFNQLMGKLFGANSTDANWTGTPVSGLAGGMQNLAGSVGGFLSQGVPL